MNFEQYFAKMQAERMDIMTKSDPEGVLIEYTHRVEYFDKDGKAVFTEELTTKAQDDGDAWYWADDTASIRAFEHTPPYANWVLSLVE